MDVSDIKKLREATGGGVLECKKILESCNGDYDKAYEALKKKGVAKAAKREGKDTLEGTIGSYIHTNGKIGAMVELNCETDFVAKNDVVQDLVKDICMQIAALNPLAISRDDIAEDVLQKRKEEILKESEGKPADILEKIIDGKLNAFYKENCLLEQPFIKDGDNTIQDLINNATSKTGEKIKVNKIIRFAVGV